MKFEFHASQFADQHTQEERQQFTVEFEAITSAMFEAMKSGVSPHSPEVQELVQSHFEFVSRFWTPNQTAYKNLALMYIVPSDYRDYYENVGNGLSKFTYDAICIWADANLTD